MKIIVERVFLVTIIICSLTAFAPVWCKRSGIEGYLYKVSGNQMPSPDIKPAPPTGIKGTLFIYELTNISQTVKLEGSFYSSVSTKLIKKVETNDKGYFKVKLPPGKYSLFIQKDTVLYANRFDSQNNVAPIEVQRKKMAKVDVRMDYSAVY